MIVPLLSNDAQGSQVNVPSVDSDLEMYCIINRLENLIVSEYVEDEHDHGEIPVFAADVNDECETGVATVFLDKVVADIRLQLTKKSDLLK